ncbi:hypothetical protein GpartN1_g1477.t1 [Galdieria partita]|uniref:Uncharacterized protein n=1 Tax=Galdieria partita TaxID=83374 RepID=A0A9C7UNN0_9RHOD|nr:hypothetical protein GpartN1_g1477.t1 [Galdieria partita]
MYKGTEGICASLIESHRTLPILVLVTNVGLLVFEVNSSKWSWVSKDINLMEQVVCVAISQQTAPLRLAVVTNDKRLLVFENQEDDSKDSWKLQQTRFFRKRPCAVIFSCESNSKILVADKSGLVHVISLSEESQSLPWLEQRVENEENFLSKDEDDDSCLGHYATIVAVTMSMNGEYVITGDRDNKIRVSEYPNTYNIYSFCLSDPHFFVTRIWTCVLEQEWLFSVHHNGEMKVWDWNGKLKLRHVHSAIGFLVDASYHIYDHHTVLVASIAYSCNYSWLWIVKYDSLRNEFQFKTEFKLDLPDVPSSVRFDTMGQLWFSFLKEGVGIHKVIINYEELLLNIENNSVSSNTEKNNKWNIFQLDTNSIPVKGIVGSSMDNFEAKMLWNRPKMLHDMRKKEYILEWKGKKRRTEYNL